MSEHCWICGESLHGVTTRNLRILGGLLTVEACAPCVDLPDTPEFVQRLLIERLAPPTESPLWGRA